jgi:hypothetical protein
MFPSTLAPSKGARQITSRKSREADFLLIKKDISLTAIADAIRRPYEIGK